jgi:hypothetical protein
MPFHRREIILFVCPICGTEYPVLKTPGHETLFECNQKSCNGQEVFSGPLKAAKALDRTSRPEPHEQTFMSSPKQAEVESVAEVSGPKQARVVTVASAILVNIVLIMTLVVLFYLVPIVLKGCPGQ